ncbi:type II toxin-antitoxin system HicA family toxin [Aequorivita viscosa]|uniref:HicA toxin of toxin-antitoxin n=1 Tax=Aequorivita viscosa TaxID=797419 RepID=A0A1M6M0M6_9FLAO|nr:type II toxin-antitoxin system HicA family toxin [Aequorivita viscosa]SDX31778.1 hypothetical protein SAMN05216556_12447 [Aequorivita viscosa]SHJ77021.1 hypothetical protein SAMN04487908_12513 [Aequorivita viscosa]
MNRKIKHKELIQLLKNIGFIYKRNNGQHLVYSYDKYNAIIVLRQIKPNDEVPEFHFAMVRKTIIGKGILTKEQFESELRKI